MLYIEVGEYFEAERDIKRALELDPDLSHVYISMSELYSMRNSPINACKWLRKGIEKGYNDWNYIKTYKTFDNIRNTSCYKKIVSGK